MKIICSKCGKVILMNINSQFMPQHKEIGSSSICYRSGYFIEDSERIVHEQENSK